MKENETIVENLNTRLPMNRKLSNSTLAMPICAKIEITSNWKK